MSHRRSSPEELRVLAEVLESFKTLPPRSEARRQMLESTCERLNGIRPDQWDVKRVRQWLSNNMSNGQSKKSLSMSFEGGVKRPKRPTEDLRGLTKRSNSFSQFGSPQTEPRSIPKELRKLETYFTLEHTRLPKVPAHIYELTSGEELSAQLKFNWLLEQRITDTCELIQTVDLKPASNETDGAVAVHSYINPFSEKEDHGGVMPMEPETQPSTPMDLEPMDTKDSFALLFGEDDDDAFGSGLGGGFDDNDMFLLDGGSLHENVFGGPARTDLQSQEVKSLPDPDLPQFRDLVHFESHAHSNDQGLVEPMNTADFGPVLAVRDGHAAAHHVNITSVPSGSILTQDGGLFFVSRPDATGPCTLSNGTVKLNGINIQERALPELEDGSVHSFAVDQEHQNLFVASGKTIACYLMSDTVSAPYCRLLSERSATPDTPAPLLMRDNILYSAVGQTLRMWSIDDIEATSTSESSQMDFDGNSEGDISPPMGFEMDLDPERLKAALSAGFCRCGVALPKKPQYAAAEDRHRDCTECRLPGCNVCTAMYRLTSLGEKVPRAICKPCVAQIQRRIQGQQQASRMPHLVQNGPATHSRHGSFLTHRSRPVPSSRRQEIKGKDDPASDLTSKHEQPVMRTVFTMQPDFSSRDSLVTAFLGRPCALSWNVKKESASRWFMGHTASITSAHTNPSEPNFVLTGSRDRSAKIWDSRIRAAATTLVGHYGDVTAVQLVRFKGSGAAFCFTGGMDECVKVWDLRKNMALYELSTGNNAVQSLAWNTGTSSLICTTLVPPGRPLDSAWPNNAVHQSTHYPRAWNAGANQILQYDFTALL